MKSILLSIVALLAISCDGKHWQYNTKTDVNMTNRDINKQLVQEFYKKVIGKKDSDYAMRILTDDYIQHNPMVKTGKAGVLEAIEMLRQLPTPKNPPKPLMRLIAEDDLVIIHLNVEFAGQKKVVLDLFRLENGLIAEHWDAIQDVTSLGLDALSAIEGPLTIEDHALTAQNKAIIETFCQEVLMDGRLDKLPKYVSKNLIQHTPTVRDGLSSFEIYLGGLLVEKVHRIIAEGNFVVTQSSGITADLPYVFYNIYRLKNGKVQEHWSVSQAIPEVMAHDNGMI